MQVVVDGATRVHAAVTQLLDALDAIDRDGRYPAIDVVRPWSVHNPRLSGEFAPPRDL